MRQLVFASVIAVSLPAAAFAGERSAGEQLDEVLEDVLDALTLVMRAVPQYELPEVLPNGDIIIRRVQPEGQEKTPPQEPQKDGDDSVKT